MAVTLACMSDPPARRGRKMGKVTWEGWQTDASKAAQPATGVVIPFNPRRPREEQQRCYDLAAVLDIVDCLKPRSAMHLLLGVLLFTLIRKNGSGNVPAISADFAEFARRMRREIGELGHLPSD